MSAASGYPASPPDPAAQSLRIAVLISGGGSTLDNLIRRISDGRLTRVTIVQVLSSRADARGVAIARQAGLPVEIVRRGAYAEISAFGAAMRESLLRCGAQIVVLAGYLTLLPIPPEFHGRVLNIHPALLPAFGGRGMYGHHVHQAVLAAGAHESGCTVHLVDEQYDHGPIIAQARTDVRPDDTPDALANRVMALERELYPAVIQRIADDGPAWLDRREAWPLTGLGAAGVASHKEYTCPTCGRVMRYEGRLPALHPFCSSRCRWVDLGRWFRGEYSIDGDLPADDEAAGGVAD